MPINQMEPLIEQEERDAVNEYMASGGWLTEHTKTKEFASMLGEFLHIPNSYIMANGTVSLVAALKACGVGPGDEVLVPDFTMVATANAIELIGATVTFVDVDPLTLGMDYLQMVAKISEKTKAVIIVPINGRCPSDFEKMITHCHKEGLWIIEDAAQALGSKYKGQYLGTFGDIGSFSFSMPKIITTGQGGALVTAHAQLSENIRLIRDFGREKPGADHYLTEGVNFKFTDLQAVIGIEQMKKLPARLKRKQEIISLYYSALKDVAAVTLFPHYDNGEVLWFMDVLVPDRDNLIAFLKLKGIGSRPFYPALHSEPVYGRVNESYPIASDVAERGLWLPSSLTLSNGDVEMVCSAIRQYYTDRRIEWDR